ncbi:MAG: S-layer homology domain-containing protein [Bacillota bacterium]
MFYKKTISFFTAIYILFSVLVVPACAGTPPAGEFPDVPNSYWAYGMIKLMSINGWIHGYPDGAFRPEAHMTRAELASIIANIKGEGPDSAASTEYSDVVPGKWYTLQVKSAGKYFDTDPSLAGGLFRPDDYVTRQEAVAAITKARLSDFSNSGPAELQAAFNDFGIIAPEYRQVLACALKNGLVRGYADGSFRPESFLTRAEASSLLFNAFHGGTNLEGLFAGGVLKATSQSSEEFSPLKADLQNRFGSIDDIEIKFYINDIPVPGQNEKIIFIYARVDPFKYFTFSDAVFPYGREKVRQYAENVTTAASEQYPGRKVATLVGYTNFTFYSTTPDVYGAQYVRRSVQEGGWRIERNYAAALGLDGGISEWWLEPVKNKT